MKKRRLTAMLICLVLAFTVLFTSCGTKGKDLDDEKTEQDTPSPTEKEKPDDGKEGAEATPKPDGGDKEVSGDTVFDYKKDINVLTLNQEDKFDSFLNELYLLLITTDSFTLHFKMQNPSEYGINLPYTYGDEDADSLSEEFIKKVEEGLRTFDYAALTDSQQVIYDLLAYELDMYEKGEAFDDDSFYVWALSQNNNFISGIQSMFTEYSIQTEEDAEDFIELLKLFPDYLEAEQENIKEDMDDGARLTKAMYDMSLDMAEDWMSDTPEENIIYVAFESNLQEADLDDESEQKYLSDIAEVIEDELLPAIEDYRDFIEGLGGTDESEGLCSFENGKEYYDWLLESYIGAGMTPDELFNYVSAKYDEAWERIMEIGEENPIALATFAYAESVYSDDPEEIMQALAEHAKEEFPDVGELDWIISYLDERQEVESVAAYYLSPQLDNIGRRVIRVNGSNVSDSVSLFTTLAHEGIPGHLFQDEFSMRKDNYQEMNSALTYLGYQEGWAMYVEKLAYGWCLESEVNAELNNLNNMLSFMMISMADIGINYKGWSREEFESWMAEQGITDEESLDYIYEMSVSDPGLYPAYGIGYLLMEDTVEALVEDSYTEKEAYEKILDVGCSPFTVLWNRLGIDADDIKYEYPF